MADKKDTTEIMTRIAVLLTVCETIKDDVKEIKTGMGQHNNRIRSLEIGQESLRTELRAEIRNKSAIATAIAVISGFVSGYFGIGK
jgi:capsule polysaccharide export protein KpsE/RkpR